MRTIEITSDLHAAIWAERLPGEQTEDQILCRLLEAAVPMAERRLAGLQTGFRDDRSGVVVAEGFEIFRTHKGVKFRATALAGEWSLLNTGVTYATLNQLSRAVSGNAENAWRSWYFRGSDGNRHMITDLRSDVAFSVRRLV